MQYLIQLQFLKVKEICHIFKISTKIYYVVLKNEDDDGESSLSVGRPPNVSKEEKEALLSKLETQQCKGDCFSPRQAREWLEEYIKEQL